jgi:tRNA(fMet)-specific endonuclease VapC
MKWMLDTNTCIAMIRRQPGGILRKLGGKSIGQVGMSSITLAELHFGVAKSSRAADAAAALAEFLMPLEVAAFDAGAAQAYGMARSELARRGTPIGPLDTLIAGHALALDAVLVTHNTREFQRVKGLRIEDWIGKA